LEYCSIVGSSELFVHLAQYHTGEDVNPIFEHWRRWNGWNTLESKQFTQTNAPFQNVFTNLPESTSRRLRFKQSELIDAVENLVRIIVNVPDLQDLLHIYVSTEERESAVESTTDTLRTPTLHPSLGLEDVAEIYNLPPDEHELHTKPSFLTLISPSILRFLKLPNQRLSNYNRHLNWDRMLRIVRLSASLSAQEKFATRFVEENGLDYISTLLCNTLELDLQVQIARLCANLASHYTIDNPHGGHEECQISNNSADARIGMKATHKILQQYELLASLITWAHLNPFSKPDQSVRISQNHPSTKSIRGDQFDSLSTSPFRSANPTRSSLESTQSLPNRKLSANRQAALKSMLRMQAQRALLNIQAGTEQAIIDEIFTRWSSVDISSPSLDKKQRSDSGKKQTKSYNGSGIAKMVKFLPDLLPSVRPVLPLYRDEVHLVSPYLRPLPDPYKVLTTNWQELFQDPISPKMDVVFVHGKHQIRQICFLSICKLPSSNMVIDYIGKLTIIFLKK
jgi:hypothetical protein